jgi:hexosaminidase
MYAYDPTKGLSESEKGKILGGEVAMWGEHVDENNFMGIVYPRASSVGERLWSAVSVVDEDDALARLTVHRCRMIARGVHPGAIQPGYCSSSPAYV